MKAIDNYVNQLQHGVGSVLVIHKDKFGENGAIYLDKFISRVRREVSGSYCGNCSMTAFKNMGDQFRLGLQRAKDKYNQHKGGVGFQFFDITDNSVIAELPADLIEWVQHASECMFLPVFLTTDTSHLTALLLRAEASVVEVRDL